MKNKMFIDMLPIETERLKVRPISVDDVDLMLKMDKQEVTQKFLGGIKNRTREERINLIESKANKFKNNHASMLTVLLKDGTSIGFVGLSINDEENKAVLSYLFDYDYCNKGYCTEICRKLVDVAFNDLKLDSIFADTVVGNNSSKRVLEKLEFELQEKVIKNSVEFLNYIIYKKDY